MPKDPTPTPDDAPVEEVAVEPTPNAVLIIREFGENGQPAVSVVPLGDVRVTEIPVILKLGIREFNRVFEV